MIQDSLALGAVVFMFCMSPILERVPHFRRVPDRWKPAVVSAMALLVSAAVLGFRVSAEGGVSAESLVGSAWVALLGLVACTTGYTMMVVPFGDKASREFLKLGKRRPGGFDLGTIATEEPVDLIGYVRRWMWSNIEFWPNIPNHMITFVFEVDLSTKDKITAALLEFDRLREAHLMSKVKEF